jgi:hypothetical protein
MSDLLGSPVLRQLGQYVGDGARQCLYEQAANKTSQFVLIGRVDPGCGGRAQDGGEHLL